MIKKLKVEKELVRLKSLIRLPLQNYYSKCFSLLTF